MAPEQVRGEVDAVDERTDVFAIGAMLYHLLTGRAPHDASNVAELIRQATTRRPPSVRRLAPHAQPALLAICKRALAPRPEARCPSSYFREAIVSLPPVPTGKLVPLSLRAKAE